MNYLRQNEKSDRLKMMGDTLAMLNLINQKYENQRVVLDDLIATLAANKVVGGANTGMSVTELQKLMDYTFTKTTQIRNDLIELEGKTLKNQEKINKISNQMNEENAKLNQPSGEVVLQIVSNNSTNADFNFNPFIQFTAANSTALVNSAITPNLLGTAGTVILATNKNEPAGQGSMFTYRSNVN
jgi:hypothetical protein